MSTEFDHDRYRVLVEFSLDALALITSDGRISYVSPSISRVLGYPADEFVARSPFELVHPEDRGLSLKHFNDLLGRPGGAQVVVNRVRHKDGSWRWIETTSTNQLANSSVAAIVSSLRDVTPRQRADQLIRDAEERFRLIIESATEFAIFTTDLDGRVDSWNSGAGRLLGYSEEEVIGQDCRIFFTPEDNARSVPEAEMSDAIIVGKGEDQRWHIRKDGSRFWGSGLMMPLRDDSGNVRGYLKIFRDMTREKLAEERLKEVDRQKDEFLAILAHELRNPLAAIGNSVQVLKLPDGHQNLEWSRDIIERQTRHLARLLDDLLDVSRITRGKIQIRRELLDISSVISKAIEAVRPAIEKKRHHLTVDITPGVMKVSGDAVRLEQVLVNILDNAIKYTDEGGRIAVAAHNGKEVAITVQDNGIGIAPEMLPRVFDLFARADRSLDKSQGGLGIGLTLVRTLVELHGGRVSADSAGLGKGSTFRVTLPLTANSASLTDSDGMETNDASFEGFRVLIVDDNQDVLSSIALLLSQTGYDTLTATDGHSALDLATSTNPHAVILDIGLPGLDGYEVAKQLRASASCHSALLIAISGYGRDEDRRRSKEAGFDHHFVKPVDFAALSKLMATYVTKYFSSQSTARR